MSELPIIDMIKTGQNIKKLRKEMGLSVRDLQIMFGFTTPQAIYKWQHGDCMPSIDNLLVLATIFQVHMEDILVIDRNKHMQISA
jgi:transcriptional regulator with XRE-family HTH domain